MSRTDPSVAADLARRVERGSEGALDPDTTQRIAATQTQQGGGGNLIEAVARNAPDELDDLKNEKAKLIARLTAVIRREATLETLRVVGRAHQDAENGEQPEPRKEKP